MDETYDMPWMGGRDRTPIIEFGKWMRSRPPYRCVQCGSYFGGLYKPVWCCPRCGEKVKRNEDKRD